MAVAVAILAAGRGSRLRVGRRLAKPAVEIHGRPLVRWAADAALESGLAPVFVVVGQRARRVARAVPPGVTVVKARDWSRGIAHSLGAAIAFVEADPSVDALCVGLADQPLIGSEAYRRLGAAHGAGAQLAVATYDGQRTNPVLLGRSLWSEVRALRGDVGARALMETHEVVEVDCTGTGDPVDVDTLEDLRTIERSTAWNDRLWKDRDADH